MHVYFHILSLTIPGYGLMMVIGIIVGMTWAILRAKRAGIDPNDVFIIGAFAAIGAFIGGSLLYLIASYGLANVWRDIVTGEFTFLRNGGLVFYGGLIGGMLGIILGSIVSGEKRVQLLSNALTPCIPLGHAFGRVGCLFGGCCYGLPYDGPFCVDLSDSGNPGTFFPIQLVEAALNCLLAFVLARISRKTPRGFTLPCLYALCYGVERFVLEFFRGDQIRGIQAGLSTSQWISLGLVILGFLGILWNRREKA